jgi:uncharacterized membrane protein YsdA (DUF1294 family)/cold shock CspA family protein
MRHKGRIDVWKDDEGYGFITPALGGDRVFVHVTAFSRRGRRPVGQERVTYELAMDDRGRPQARSVAFAGEAPLPTRSFRRGPLAPMVAGSYLLTIACATFIGWLPVVVLLLHVSASLVAFLVYASDKSAARSGRWRTPESTLHLLGLIGGWPGALAAQRLLRHKSVKTTFQMTFWFTVVLNCGAVGWLMWPLGMQALEMLLM